MDTLFETSSLRPELISARQTYSDNGCGNLRLIIGSSRKLRRPRRGYEGLGYETGYETGMKRV
jgi:hypothetical protein